VEEVGRFDGTCTLEVLNEHLAFFWSTEGLPVPAALIATMVSDILRPQILRPGLSTIDQIIATIEGSKQTRFAPRLDPQGRALLRKRVEAAVSRNEPISLLTMWGSIKHYVQDKDQGIDLAELFAALRLAQLAADIGEVYPPGARMHVIIEDFNVWFEDAYGFPAVVQQSITWGSQRYSRGLISLFNVIAGKALQPYLFFEVIDSDIRECIARAEHNRELIYAYWMAEPDSAATAFDKLREVGWRGEIGDERRRHYLARLAKLYPAESLGQRVDRICRYLAMALLMEQFGLLSRVDPQATRLAFYQPPTGVPRERTFGRVNVRGLPRKYCSAVMPPWTARGCLVVAEHEVIRPRLESFLELYRSGSTFHPGSLRVTRGGHEAELRMDLILRDGRAARNIELKQQEAT
jgi:hypothetical protein